MGKHALLLRMNPAYWPLWESRVLPSCETDVWYKTGQLRPEDIQAGIPVIVLGTGGIGVVACGKTSTGVEVRADPDWREAGTEEDQADCRTPKNRVCVKIRRVYVSLAELKSQPFTADLHHRRQTATWLNVDQYQVLSRLINAAGAALPNKAQQPLAGG
jgi:hypothetical protein